MIDPETGRPVPYSERGQVVMNHISTIMFVPKNLERETALRVAGPEGHLPAHTPKPFLIGRHSGGAADAAARHHLVGNEAFRETNPGAAAVRHRRTRTSAMRDMKARARTYKQTAGSLVASHSQCHILIGRVMCVSCMTRQ